MLNIKVSISSASIAEELDIRMMFASLLSRLFNKHNSKSRCLVHKMVVLIQWRKSTLNHG
ncbi:hypothetical protein REPUB_Repub12eG0033800 [Reevesia pubescens]